MAAREERIEALVDGALIALGAVAVVDTLLLHWTLGLHRAVPGKHAFAVELALVAIGAAMLAVGLGRELRAWKGMARGDVHAASSENDFDSPHGKR